LKYGLCRLLFAAVWLVVGVSNAAAQTVSKISSGLVAPDEIVLYIHSELKSTDFVEPLVCALRRVLIAPVSTQMLELPLESEMLATPTQFDVSKVADRFIRETATHGSSQTFKYLLVPFDLKSEPWRYVFSASFGNETTPYHIGVVSTARLDVGNPRQNHHQGAAITTLRTYKLILKSIARVAGLGKPEGCILAFPRSLDELDQKSSEFCPNDRALLVSAGILKPVETPDCIDRRPAKPLVAQLNRNG